MTQVAVRQSAWAPQPRAQQLVSAVLGEALRNAPEAQSFANKLRKLCGIRLQDILDHIALPIVAKDLERAGWTPVAPRLWRHFHGTLPDVLEREHTCIAFRVESVERFLRANNIETPIEGATHGPYRRARIFAAAGVAFDAVERNGWEGFDVPVVSERTVRRARIHQQIFRTRPRQFKRTECGFTLTERLIDAAIADIGAHWACDLFMRAEREHWMASSDVGRSRGKRHDAAGLGWTNVDHFAFNASRAHLWDTIRLLERLGWERRELVRGQDGDCCAQVLEHAGARPTVLVQFDCDPAEPLPEATLTLAPSTWLGPTDAWCALHGQSILEGGLCYVAGLHERVSLDAQLRSEGISLAVVRIDQERVSHQCTPSQRRAVNPTRVDTLERGGYLTREQAESLRFDGAAATYFRSLERNCGFKGFDESMVGPPDTLRFERPAVRSRAARRRLQVRRRR